jgi:glycosyltransferase involved in cell wall biosynthesis
VLTPLLTALTAVESEPDLVRALHAAEDLARVAAREPDPAGAARLLGDALGEVDALTALALVHALGRVVDDEADRLLVDLLDADEPALVEHAAWVLGGRMPSRHAYGRLVGEVARSGFGSMVAQRTLVVWAGSDPDGVTAALDVALAVTGEDRSRAHLADTLGAVDDPRAVELARRLALDRHEPVEVRIAALGSLGEGSPADLAAVLDAVVADHPELAAHVELLRGELEAPVVDPAPGLRIAQLCLVGDLDPDLTRGGRGDTGGVASLLASLSGALAAQPQVASVVTIGRGRATDAVRASAGRRGDEVAAFVPFGPADGPPPDATQSWAHRIPIQRGIRRALVRNGPIDILHLRMADVGSLAGASAARRLGIPVAFSLAPDPHAVIGSLQARGELDRDGFGRVDHREHLWFRVRMVERLAVQADRVALFPRAEPPVRLAELVGVDPAQLAAKAQVVPEGIDVAPVRRAEARLDGGELPGVLVALGERLPLHRRGLPLIVTAGRFHPVKGIERVVRAWAGDPELVRGWNLVVVGGDLDQPSPVERGVLDEVTAALSGRPGAADGVVLLGARPRADVAVVLAAARLGWRDVVAAGGVYVNGAIKEEFGLALLEALAAGLPVVAPAVGGPATYVEPGRTGVLVPPGDDLAIAMREALGLLWCPGRAEEAAELVRSRFAVERAAEVLLDLYAPVAAAP